MYASNISDNYDEVAFYAFTVKSYYTYYDGVVVVIIFDTKYPVTA